MTIGDRYQLAVQRLLKLALLFEPLGCTLQIQQPIQVELSTTTWAGQRPRRLAVRHVGIRQTLSDGGIAPREQCNHLIAFGEE